MAQLSQDDVELAHLRRLAASLDTMRLNNSMTDITILCGRQEFPAHRLVLAAGSPYFQSMLRSEWKDTMCERYGLLGWSADTFAAILSFLYKGQLKDASMVSDQEAMTDLLEAADYFQIEDLVEYCFKTISDLSLTVTNFSEMYALGDKFNNPRQVSRIEDLLSPNFIEASKSEDFLHLNDQQVQGILRHPNVDHQRMEEALTAVLKWTEFDSQHRCKFLTEFMDTFNLYWCPVLSNDLILQNVSMGTWNTKTTHILSEMLVNLKELTTCHQKTNHIPKLVCFGDDKVHSYDLGKDKWLPAEQLPFFVDDKATAISHKRHIFFLGGEMPTQIVDSKPTGVAQYCPFLNSVIDPSSGGLLFDVYCAGSVVFNDYIYVVNGQNTEGAYLNIVQRYDPKDGTCQQVASTVKRHGNPFAFAFQKHIFIFGGTTPGWNSCLERYDTVRNQWTEMTAVSRIRDLKGVIHSAFSGTKIFCLHELNLEHPLHMIDVFAQERDSVNYNGGPDIVITLWSVQRNGKDFLAAMDHRNAPHFYDIASREWVKEGPSNSGYKMWHHLSCFV